MFKLVTASFPAIEEQFISDIGNLRRSDPLGSILVLIPTGRLRTQLQQKLLIKQPGLLNIHFLTFFGLAEQILSDGPLRADRVVGESALYREIIRDLLEGTADVPFKLREEFLGAGKQISRGLPGALAGTLKDLRDAGVRVTDALKAALEGHLGADAESAAPTLELYAHVYGVLQKLQLRTPSALLRRAAEHASESAFLRRQKSVLVYGFYDLTGVQLDLLLALAHQPQATLYVPYEQGNPAYAFAERLLLEPALGMRVEGEGLRVKGDNSGPSTRHSPPSTTFTSCSGARDEVWFAAKEIQRLLDDGIAPQEIAVIARRIDPYFSALRDLFKNHQIPYITSKNESAGAHPWIKALRAEARKTIDTVTTSWNEHCLWAEQMAVTSAIASMAETHVNGEDRLIEAVTNSLAQLKILDVLNKPVSRQHFIDTWEEKLDALEMPGPALSFAGVQVLEVQQARGLRFKAVFLLGLNEKIFPRLIREDPFLSDAARSRLSQALGVRLSRKMDGYQEERFLFELMKQTAETYLYLVWQRSDEEGKAVIPSLYIQDLQRSQKTKAARLARSLPDKLKDRPAASLTPKELSYVINRAGLVPDPLYAALGWDTAHFHRLLQAHRAVESFRPGILALDGRIEYSPVLKNMLTKGFSPSGLEDLAACPYQFYAGHVLRVPVSEDPAPGGQLAPNALGKLFHRTLELFYAATPVIAPVAGAHVDVANVRQDDGLKKALDQAFLEFTTTYSGLYPLVIKSSKQKVYQYLSSFIETETEEFKDSGFTPFYAEQILQSSITELGPELAHIAFRGRTDRIDLKKENGNWMARVVDYKSGKARKVTGSLDTALIQGKFLQLPIYMGLVRAFLSKEKEAGVHVDASLIRWLRLEDQGQPEPILLHSFWKSPAAKTFIENMKGLIEIADVGHFYIEPDTSEWGHCSRCAYARICRKEHMPTRARAEGDPIRLANVERLQRTAKSENVKA